MLVEAGSALNWSRTWKQGAMRMKWETVPEISTRKPKHYPHQKPALKCSSDQHCNKCDLSWQSRPLEEGTKRPLIIAFYRRIWFSLSTPVEISSCQDLTGISSLAPRHENVAKTSMHMNGDIELYMMKIKSQGYPWGRLSWELSSAPHI